MVVAELANLVVVVAEVVVVVVEHIRMVVEMVLPVPVEVYCRLAQLVPLGRGVDFRFHQLIRVHFAELRLDHCMRKSHMVDRHSAEMFRPVERHTAIAEMQGHSVEKQERFVEISTGKMVIK